MTIEFNQETSAQTAARKARWDARDKTDKTPLSAEELYEMLEKKGTIVAGDRPRLKK